MRLKMKLKMGMENLLLMAQLMLLIKQKLLIK